jgi:DNA-binding LacI/PurR family transcriptional regulator
MVAVAGCDGLPIGEHTIPKLTTVRLDYRALGRAAVERVLASHKRDSTPCRIRLLPELLIRESTVTPSGDSNAARASEE